MMQLLMSLMNGRYLPHELLGTGTYGRVLRCTDTYTGQQVAVKIAQRNVAYRRAAMNEIHVLRLLSHNDNILHMRDFFEENGHLCIVSELLRTDLYEVLHTKGLQPLSLDAVRLSGERVLRALAELHRIGYMHCDIKPANVMLRPSETDTNNVFSYAKTCLIDFGAVRQFHENKYYDVQSLWYRAPEVMLGVPYTPLIDSWSVGCLLFELYTGKTLFSGDSAEEQLHRIACTVGMPSIEALLGETNSIKLQLPCSRMEVNPEANLRYLIGKYRLSAGDVQHSRHSFEEEEAFLKLLCMLLQPDARRRLLCADALHHSFFTPSCRWSNSHNNNNTNSSSGGRSYATSSNHSVCNVNSSSGGVLLTGDISSGLGTLPTGSETHNYNSVDCVVPQCQQPQFSFMFPDGRGTIPFMGLVDGSSRVMIHGPFAGTSPSLPASSSSSSSHIAPRGLMYSNVAPAIIQSVPFQVEQQKQMVQQPHLMNMCVSAVAPPTRSFLPCLNLARRDYETQHLGPMKIQPGSQPRSQMVQMVTCGRQFSGGNYMTSTTDDMLPCSVSVVVDPHDMVRVSLL